MHDVPADGRPRVVGLHNAERASNRSILQRPTTGPCFVIKQRVQVRVGDLDRVISLIRQALRQLIFCRQMTHVDIDLNVAIAIGLDLVHGPHGVFDIFDTSNRHLDDGIACLIRRRKDDVLFFQSHYSAPSFVFDKP